MKLKLSLLASVLLLLIGLLIIFLGNGFGIAFIIVSIAILHSYFFKPKYCRDCGQYCGRHPNICKRCGCNRFTTDKTNVGLYYKH
jgi:hypothetical protein